MYLMVVVGNAGVFDVPTDGDHFTGVQKAGGQQLKREVGLGAASHMMVGWSLGTEQAD